ncbi:hypothetical protein Airi02_040100 [Actinoallomurus iriomotensis]|uniref:Uncharacterized protein n=1 Tax=Actinoallomurus iriomotensis TaxID=478107 RepID=A0A9W6S083_9ACTN|nr:hypothetical protein Airi02_040100 [Actinoallomurus iriomotensis]
MASADFNVTANFARSAAVGTSGSSEALWQFGSLNAAGRVAEWPRILRLPKLQLRSTEASSYALKVSSLALCRVSDR